MTICMEKGLALAGPDRNDGIGLDRDATIGYVERNAPTYAQFKAWVRTNAAAGKLGQVIDMLIGRLDL